MTVYAESSAVLAWLLQDARGADTGAVLERADAIVASDLTVIECERTLRRVVRLGVLGGTEAGAIERRFTEITAGWLIEAISPAVVDRARQPFPDDAIRSLDAIHLATALVVRAAAGDVDVLSLDERVRSNARALGFRVLPA